MSQQTPLPTGWRPCHVRLGRYLGGVSKLGAMHIHAMHTRQRNENRHGGPASAMLTKGPQCMAKYHSEWETLLGERICFLVCVCVYLFVVVDRGTAGSVFPCHLIFICSAVGQGAFVDSY